MNLIEMFQDLMARVPELVQPLVVALAGAVPFIEGEGAAAIGIIGGIHPVVAIIAGAIGNFACVAVLVFAGSGARSAIVARSRARRGQPALVGAGSAAATPAPSIAADARTAPRASARRVKFQRALDRYGVPGVALLGPLLLPTQFTATMLAAVGVSRARVLFWEGLAIVLWTTAIGALVGGAVHGVG